MVFDVIILAGGRGSRMNSAIPKALIQFNNKPIIAHQIDKFLKDPLSGRIVLSLSFLSDKVIDFVKNDYPDNERLIFSVETEPLGTGGGIRKAMGLCDTEFVAVVNCDILSDIKLQDLGQHKRHTICVAHPTLQFGLVNEEEGYAKFCEKPVMKDWVSMGWYLFEKTDMLNRLPEKGSIEYEVLPKLKMKVFKWNNDWIYLDSKRDIDFFEEKYPNWLG